jgi:hypothetical protein
MKKNALSKHPNLESAIIELRGHKVILDLHLASIYGIPTKFLNRAVKRNSSRFRRILCFS